MADFDEAPLPLGPRAQRMLAANRNRLRARSQRRMSPDGMREPDVIGGRPGPGNESGRSEQDAQSPEQVRQQLSALASSVSNAAGQGLAQPQAPVAPQATAIPANPFGAPVDDEPERVARVDGALARLNPAQLARVQALPVSGEHEDDDSNDDALIGAASRAQGMPVPPSTQLRAPMSGAAARASTPLRAPAVMDEIAPPDEDFEDDVIGPRPTSTTRRALPSNGEDLDVIGRNLYAEQDAQDRAESERIADQRRRAQIAATVVGFFGQGQNVAQGMVAPYDPQAPFARRSEQRQNDFAQQMAEREAGLEERRIAQGEAAVQQRAGYRDADILPDHPNAQNERALYAASFAALPEHIRDTFPGFDPSNPSVQQTQAGLGAAQIRRQLELLNEQVNTRFPDEGDWRSTVSSGGRARRGQLAGFGGQAHTVRRGDSGVTPEQLMQMDASGVDEIDVPASAAPAPRAPSAAGAQRPRTGGPGMQAAPAPQGPPQAAQQGRALVDRPLTDAERAGASMDERTTEAAVQAYMNAHVMRADRYAEAAARVNGMTPDQRGQLIRDWGNERMNFVPGWRRVSDTGAMTPARLSEVRSYAQQANTAAALSREILQHIDHISTLNLAENQLAGNREVQTALGKARRLQTLLRIVDRTGVPTGNEQARAMEEAPEPITPMQLLRARASYEAYPASILSITYQNMRGEGFLPERPRGGR